MRTDLCGQGALTKHAQRNECVLCIRLVCAWLFYCITSAIPLRAPVGIIHVYPFGGIMWVYHDTEVHLTLSLQGKHCWKHIGVAV